ncbi:hypothetical protein HAHE_41930 [Haloferula helveola]|uniref:VWA domain-containing protein n=1 Tax=Haloferula helveola TaxID=490095 RepID=A0ABN6HHY4_9BACT|nr:hypothetical protein HAHE_41930 [Haloferula helveola]
MKRVLRFLAVAALAWGVLFGASQFVRLAPGWPLLAVALSIALAVELILDLGRYERAAVSPQRARWITALRLAALGVLAWILLEPTWVRTVTRENERELVVVFDDSASMHLKDDGETLSRIEQGEQAVADAELVEQLSELMRVRTVRAARSVRDDSEVDAGWNQSTDLAAALNTVLEQVPPDELAGVVLVTDGRHNRPARVEEVARRFGILDAPVGVLATGSPKPPKDAAVLSVRAPEAVHLGDRMRVTAELKFDGYKGKTAKVRLLREGQMLEERDVRIPQENHREEVRFAQIPEAGGVGDFRVEIEGLEGERFDDNNGWDFETSITDARTNVLVVDGHPRWEFRYLRNLFYGRDKSVHLQWVLTHPDGILGASNDSVAASASRPFGEAQATELPKSAEEWKKFDVIILGDVSDEVIDDDTWRVIRDCVNERAALLVMVSGPEHMPHGIISEVGRGLVPVDVEWGARTYFSTGGEPFRIGMTGAGVRHPVTQQADGAIGNEALWAGFPEMRWRHPVRGVKEGAEVLLYAEEGSSDSAAGEAGLSARLDALARRREREAEQALLVTRQTGKGKVAMLLTDRTWRLRVGSGDVYHHRFWGNLVRWGAGPTLRSGGARVRLGTDQLTYTPDDKVRLTVRLRDADLNPVFEEDLEAEVLRDGEQVATVPLRPVEGSNGLHEAEAGPFDESGKYEVRIRGGRADDLMREDEVTEFGAGFRVVGARGPVELADTTLNLPLLQTVADLSGGKVCALETAKELPALFLGEAEEKEEVRETSLWDHWVVLSLFAGLLTVEWLLRRGGGLP